MITAMSPLTWMYIRFSNKARQSDGDSEARHDRTMRNWCHERGFATDENRILIDRGKSGYRGANLSPRSAFGGFLKLVQQDRVPRGSVLVVEQIDRITRLRHRKAVEIIDLLCDHQIRVACVDTGSIYDAESSDNLLSRFGLMMLADLAHKESEAKSGRNSGVWMAKTDNRRRGGAPPTTRCPSWMAWDPEVKDFAPNEHARTVARIFDLCLTGLGMDRIAATLNRDNVPTLPQAGDRVRAKAWNANSVRRILISRATYGAWQPTEVRSTVEDGVENTLYGKVKTWTAKEVRTARGDAIQDHYPGAISRSTFDDAKRARAARERTGGRGGGTRNPLAGRMVCAGCGGPIQRTIDRRSYKHESFYCPARRTGTCDSGYVPAEAMTLTILERVRHAFALVAGRREPERDAAYDRINEKTADKEALERELRDWRQTRRGKPISPAVEAQFDVIAEEISAAKNEIAELRRKLQTLDVRSAEVPPEYDALLADFAAGPGPARERAARLLSQALREVVERIELNVGNGLKGRWRMWTPERWGYTSSAMDKWGSRHAMTAEIEGADLDTVSELFRPFVAHMQEVYKTASQEGREIARLIEARAAKKPSPERN